MKDAIAKQVEQLFQIDPFLSIVLVAAVSYVFGLVGRMTGTGILRLYEGWRYGGWTVEVSGGASGRHWHAPLDREIVRHLKRRHYFAFKQGLGTVISGEGQFPFTFGTEVTDPVAGMPPTAPGLTIDAPRKRVVLDYGKATRPTPSKPHP